MQSDKDKEQQPGQPSQQDSGGGMNAAPQPPKQKNGMFGMKGPQKPSELKSGKIKKPAPPKPQRKKKEKPPRKKKLDGPKPPKGPRKPLFSFGRKKLMPTPISYPAPESGKNIEPSGTPPVNAEKGEVSKPEKKSFLGGAKKTETNVPKPEKVKAPKPEKVKKPKVAKVKKPKPEKAKKPKVAKGPKKPFFSFRKKSSVPATTVGRSSATAPLGEAEPVDRDAEAASKGIFGKKGLKQPKVKDVKRPGSKKSRSTRGSIGGSKTSAVGLDLGRSSMTAVRLRYQTGGSILLQAANDSLPDGLIQEGEVRDVDALSFAIKDFWKKHKIKGKKVALGLANQKVVVRTLEFPMLDEKELRQAIEFQAQDYIPIPIDDAVFDFHVLGQFTDEDGIEKQKVLVVAAQKVMVMDFINAIKGAKLMIDGVDLQAFALLRSLAPTSFLDQGPNDRAVAIANIGSDVTNLVVDLGGEPQFTRIISFGGDDFTKALQDLKGMSFMEAEKLKAEIGLSDPASRVDVEGMQEISKPESMEEVPQPESMQERAEPEVPMQPETGAEEVALTEHAAGGPGESSDEEPRSDAAPKEVDDELEINMILQRTLEGIADSFADEIRRSLDYYMSQEQSAPIGVLYISGGGALLKNLDAHLSQIFTFTVETGNPMMRISESRTEMSDDELQALAPQLAIAIGLALEDEG